MTKKEKLTTFLLTAVTIVADQIAKAAVATKIPIYSIGASFGGDLLRIVHVRNTGVAFSLGYSLPAPVRKVVFIAFPFAVLIAICVYYLRSDEFSRLQGWALAGIVGGGFGNLVDRIFRADGVVDFIDVKFFGIFGLERWPTFNVADATVVVCGILFAISFLLDARKK